MVVLASDLTRARVFQLEGQRTESGKLEKSLSNCHTLVTSQDLVQPSPSTSPSSTPPSDSPTPGHMEGYLFKRTSNAFKTWNRRWFYLKQNQLLYRKRTGNYTMNDSHISQKRLVLLENSAFVFLVCIFKIYHSM